jgi:hypothetical protein
VTHLETNASQNYVFTASLSAATTQEVTVAFATNPGTASGTDPGQDFVPQSGTVTFTAGQTQQLITISVLGDLLGEADETFTVVLSNPANATLGDASGTGTIENDDVSSIGIAGVSQLEQNEQNTMVFTVTISTPSATPVLVPFTTQDGTAIASDDYQAVSGTLTFAANSTVSQLITVTINGDTAGENNEDFKIVLTEPSNATFDASQGEATGTLLNDDGSFISFVQQQVSQEENQTQFVFSVTLNEASGGPVTVAFNTADGTAIAGSDYTATSGTLSFAAGITTQVITVLVIDNEISEADETFTLNLSNAQGATLADTSATGTIENDDALPSLSFESSDVAQAEGTPIVFTVNLLGASDLPVTVVFATQGGTATAGTDYTSIASSTLTFAAGETQKLITVLVNSDALNEADETFQLRLTNATNVINTEDLLATGTIANDDPLPTLTVTQPANTNEGTSASPKNFVYTATLSAASGRDVVVTWATQNGTATSPNDFTAASGTLTFVAGQTTQTFIVSVVSDGAQEPNETFTINLTNPQNVTLAQNSITADISNDDGVPTVSIANATSQNEGNVGATPFLFTVTLSAASEQQVTVGFATVNQIASTADNDFVGQSGTLTFVPGETTQVITVLVNGDTRREAPNETFAVNLTNPIGATIGAGFGNATIVDDDPEPAISISDVTQAEGDAGTTNFVFTVSLGSQSGSAISVRFATQDGTAGAGTDYNAASGTLTFAPGVTTQLITISVLGDNNVEPNETFSVVLSSPILATIADGTGVGTIQSEASDELQILPSTISGKVFVDSNNSGAQEGRELSLAGTLVTLQAQGTSTSTTTTTTAHDGSYAFNNVQPGTYILSFAMPQQYKSGAAHVGSQGGTIQPEGDALLLTLAEPGGVTGTGNNFTTSGLLTQFISQRLFLASALGAATNPPAIPVSVSITFVTNPVNAANATSTTISGTGTAGATVEVVASDGDEFSDEHSTTVAANGTWSISGINVSALADGTLTYTVIASGSGGTTDVETITTTKDTVAPNVAITTVTNPVNISNVADTTISGTGTAGATISVVVSNGGNSTAPQTTTVAAGGTWSIGGINTSALADGTLTYSVTASDTAGNTNTTSMAVVKDTVAPSVAVSMVVPDPINAENQDDVTISGTGQAGASISVIVSDADESTSTFTTTVTAGGTWSISGIDVSSLDDGTLTFSVTATDSANNTTTISTTAQKDTVIEPTTIGDVTDPINAADAATVAISGTGEAGAAITIVAGDGENVTDPVMTTVAANGTWAATIDVTSLNDGTITFSVVAIDTAGNEDSAETTAEKDTLTNVTISEVTDPIGIADADSTAVAGTGEAGATVSVVVSDGANSTAPQMAVVAAGGTWTISGIDVSSLNDGTLTYTVTITDLAGNTNVDSDTAVKTTVAITSVTDPINGMNQDFVVVSGTGQVGAGISVVAGDGDSSTDPETTTIDSEGNWSVTIDVSGLNDGTITFTVTASEGEDSVVKTITAEKDTVTPDLAITDVTDPITAANQAAVTISGTGEAGASVSIVAGDGDNLTDPETTTIDPEGNWSVTFDVSELNDGTITFTATATDLAGNTEVDTTTALKDTVTSVTISDVTDPIGIDNSDGVSIGSDDVSIGGTGEVGATISVVVSNGATALDPLSTVVDGDGNWTITNINVRTLDDGTLSFTATATDTVGNTNQESITAEKATLVVESVTDPINADNRETVVVSGTGQVGANISVVADDGDITTDPETTVVDGEGNWTVTMDVTALADVTITFTVTATDEDSIVETIRATKDTMDPAVAITSVTNPIAAANAATVAVSGTGEEGASVSVVASDGILTTSAVVTTVGAGGTWSVEINVGSLADGTITFTATASDTAGNSQETSDTANKDATAPAVLIQAVTDPVNADNQATTSIHGTSEVDATISVVVSDDGGGLTGSFTTTVDGDGDWSINNIDVTSLADGELTFTVTATDAVGNFTETSITATKDTMDPALTINAVTDPINSDNAATTSINGTGEVGAQISVVASDGVDSTMAFAITVGVGGTWLIEGIDVSALADGTITYTGTATDAAGNVNEDQITADKTSAGPLAMTDDSDDDDEEVLAAVASALSDSGSDPDAVDEALALEDEWLPELV